MLTLVMTAWLQEGTLPYMSSRAPPSLLVASTIAVLRKSAPFDVMREEDLTHLASGLKVRYFAKGAIILSPESGRVTSLFIIQRGTVQAEEASRVSLHGLAGTFTEGECFPVGALIGGRATTLVYTALKDTFCYVLDEARFREVLERSAQFHAFCTRRLAVLLEQSTRGTREAYSNRAAEELSMASPLRTAVRRPPVTLPESATVRQVLELMKARRIGSVVLTGEGGKATGIFTQTDVLGRVALAGKPLERAVSEVMTRNPWTLPGSSALSEAAGLMARHGFRHVLVTEGDRLDGVISERDLFGLQRLSMQGLRKETGQADTVDALAFVAREVRSLATAMLAQGVAAEQLTQFVSTLNDGVTQRAIELALREHDVSESGFCWMGLGSEGRNEQTLATDQDNAIIFPDMPARERDALRARLLVFADQVNRTLDACGFPLCRGDIMARNPRWCLSLGEWCDKFSDWSRNADPEALLNASIFFDFRALYGDASLVERLRTFLLEAVKERPAFLHQMAVNALQVRPPLGFFGDVVVGGVKGDTIDMKGQGSRTFVDCARILALSAGVGAVSTADRLRETGPRIRMSADEVGTAIDAFHFIQMLRLRNQESLDRGAATSEPNRIDPHSLNSLDRRILKEALRQARKLQNRVALDYRV
jgi:CBS domain-containing protein